MSTKPILFNTNMVRALLGGTKTATRCVVKPRPTERPAKKMCADGIWRLEWWDVNEFHSMKIPFRPGDILYVRETWTKLLGHYLYKADQKPGMSNPGKWRPSIHMPREAARIFLRVTDVRVERLQEIDDDDVVAEGLEIGAPFDELWNSTIKPANRALHGWEANPWVWVIEFERCEKPEGV